MHQRIISEQAGLLRRTILRSQENSPRTLLPSIVIYLEKQRGVTKCILSRDLSDRLHKRIFMSTCINTQNDHGGEQVCQSGAPQVAYITQQPYVDKEKR